jgi:iron complex outermembrane receptor protein
MFKRTRISSGVLLAIGGVLLAPAAVVAQESQRIEITGSAIRRLATEGSLPVTTISRADIEKSGATSVAELIQRLPAMQGFTTSSQSVNGGGGGTTTASLHSLGEDYTLVLLNGRRVAPFNTGSTVNLESLPLSAIERVEVLTDGASALYGSDAIAGVVNFITKKNSTAGDISVMADKVEKGGGEQRSASITKGFGDLNRDGFNILASLSYEKQNNLRAAERQFSKSGIIRGIDGQNLALRLFSSNSVPGNVLLSAADPNEGFVAFYAPNFLKTGECPPLHVTLGATCRFDFSSQVELIPQTERMTGFLSGSVKLGGSHSLFTEVIISKFESKPEFAPAAQPGLPLTQAQFDAHVVPYLGDLDLTLGDIGTLTDGDPLNDPSYNLRVFDAGGRRNLYKYDTNHFVLGAEGTGLGLDYKTSINISTTKFKDKAIGGYVSLNRFNDVIATGAWDPLDARAGEGVAALAPAVLNEDLTNDKSTYNSFNFSAQRPIATLGGGDVVLAFGGEAARQRYTANPSLINQSVGDAIIGGGGGAVPYDTSRQSYGVFGEMLLPVTKALEITGSLRYDNYDAAKNKRPYDADGNALSGTREEGKKANSATWKLATRFQPTKEVLMRASYGTGFKAPSLLSITRPAQPFGVTSGSYDCPFIGTTDPLAAICSPPDSQYDILRTGNSSTGAQALKPEKSKQFTAGIVFEPSSGSSFGIDYWQVKLRDQINFIDEQIAFADPQAYRYLFTEANDPVTGARKIFFIETPINLTKSKYEGIDLNATLRASTGLGRLTTSLTGTYMMKAEYEIPGFGLASSLGKFGPDNTVVFRWKLKGSASIETGNWTHTISGNYTPSYIDHQARCSNPTLTDAQCNAAVNAGTAVWLGPEIRSLNPTTGAFGPRVSLTRRVADYFTFDWQTKYSFNKNLDVTLGIINVLGEDPPLSIQDAGGGNMRGFDGRYADPRGRTWYLKGSYKF